MDRENDLDQEKTITHIITNKLIQGMSKEASSVEEEGKAVEKAVDSIRGKLSNTIRHISDLVRLLLLNCRNPSNEKILEESRQYLYSIGLNTKDVDPKPEKTDTEMTDIKEIKSILQWFDNELCPHLPLQPFKVVIPKLGDGVRTVLERDVIDGKPSGISVRPKGIVHVEWSSKDDDLQTLFAKTGITLGCFLHTLRLFRHEAASLWCFIGEDYIKTTKNKDVKNGDKHKEASSGFSEEITEILNYMNNNFGTSADVLPVAIQGDSPCTLHRNIEDGIPDGVFVKRIGYDHIVWKSHESLKALKAVASINHETLLDGLRRLKKSADALLPVRAIGSM